MKKSKRKRLKLTKEQKKAIWEKPKENAGVGWESKYGEPADPIKYVKDIEDV